MSETTMKILNVEYAIVGAGTSGLSAYSKISRKTDSLVMIQDGPYDTACARVGCMPSKLLITRTTWPPPSLRSSTFQTKPGVSGYQYALSGTHGTISEKSRAPARRPP